MRPFVNMLTVHPEGATVGDLELIDIDEEIIFCEFPRLLSDVSEHAEVSCASNSSGGGCPSERIANVLEKGC